MPYFHVSITTKSGNHRPEVELDVGSDELESRFLEPYRLGGPIVVAGKPVNASDLERIQIFKTPYDSNGVNAEILARDRARNVVRPVDTHGRLDPVILFQHGDDVTRNYIKGPPGYAARTQSEPTKEVRPATNAREVFVVHGRNDTAREAMFEFLRALDLHPLEWSESVTDTGKASPYIGEILDVAFSRAHAIVVLFTPDDEARLKEPFRAENDPPHETQLTGQARPNVLFEAGIAMARSQDRTILVELGDLRPYSDIGGRYTIRLDNSTQRRQELAQRLQNAGCPAKLTGTDWHTAGDFEGAISLMEGTHQQDTTGVSDSEEQRFAEMLTASRQIREHICGFLAPSNSNRTPVEAQNIVIALGALAGQMDALGMKELNQRLEMPMNIRTKLNRIMEMLAYFEMLIVGRNFEQAKKRLESYDPQQDDKAGYPETNDTL